MPHGEPVTVEHRGAEVLDKVLVLELATHVIFVTKDEGQKSKQKSYNSHFDFWESIKIEEQSL